MAKKGSYIVDYFNNRGFFGLSILLLVVFSVIASGNFEIPQRGYGTFHNLASWISSSDTSCFVAVIYLNKLLDRATRELNVKRYLILFTP